MSKASNLSISLLRSGFFFKVVYESLLTSLTSIICFQRHLNYILPNNVQIYQVVVWHILVVVYHYVVSIGILIKILFLSLWTQYFYFTEFLSALICGIIYCPSDAGNNLDAWLIMSFWIVKRRVFLLSLPFLPRNSPYYLSSPCVFSASLMVMS